jgi:hypothetical protein
LTREEIDDKRSYREERKEQGCEYEVKQEGAAGRGCSPDCSRLSRSSLGSGGTQASTCTVLPRFGVGCGTEHVSK